jgi:hypothetical protein
MPKQVMLSDTVWGEIAKRGNFGESEDDVLRRVFELPQATPDDMIELVTRPRNPLLTEDRTYELTDKGQMFLRENKKVTQKRAILGLIESLKTGRNGGVREDTLIRAMRDHPHLVRSRQPLRQLLRWYQSKDFGPGELTVVSEESG